jgi:hypothetical protein
MEGILFFAVILGIALVVWNSSTDGFQDMEAPKPSIPLISPRYQTLTKGEVMAFAPPSTMLLAPPPGQSASVNSQPATDPALEKSKSGRIQSVYESVVGFFKADAPGLQKLGDPSIQLPLSTARSDSGRLKDELAVLSRNPGLESSLTDEDVDSIEANLGYLQNKWRMSTNAMSGSPMPPTEGFQSGDSGKEGFASYEGFQPVGTGAAGTGAAGTGAAGTGAAGTGAAGTRSAGTGAAGTGAVGAAAAAAAAATAAARSGPSTSGSGNPPTQPVSDVSLKDLQDLSLKLNVEIVRLQSSGTTDLNTQSRINVLTTINQTVSDLIREVTNGTRQLKDVPLRRSDIAKFLPAMTNMNTAIPDLIKDSGLNSFLNSLFPKFSVGDISGSMIGRAMFDAYGNDFFNNLSWDVGLSYKGKAEQDIARNNASAAANTLAATTSGQSYDDRMAANTAKTHGPSGNSVTGAGYRGLLSSIVESETGMTPSYVSAGIGGAPPSVAGAAGPPSTFDWKERSKQICAQIVARGMDQNDFGCLVDPDKMNRESFSWRGYTRMVCDRLNTVYDTSIPFLCGCPPQTWAGWRQ